MDFLDEDPSSYNWLDKMKGYLVWSVKGPDLHNPFLPPIADQILVNMLEKPEVLNEFIELKCTCDGHEVFTLKNLSKPHIKAEHPCVQELKATDIITAINRLEVLDKMANELQRIQRSVLEEVRKRQKAKKSVALDTAGKTLKEIRKESAQTKQLQDVKLSSSILNVPSAVNRTPKD